MGLGYCFLLTWSLFTVAFNHADLDDSMSARMILSGIQSEDEAHLQYQLALMTKEERKGLKQGMIPIDECYYLVVGLQTTAGWRKAPALAQRVCTQGVASLRSISLKNTRNTAGFRVVRAAGA